MTNIILGGTSGLGKEISVQLRENGQDTLVLGSSYDAAKNGDGIAIDLGSERSVFECIDILDKKLGGQALESFWWVSGLGYNGDFSEQHDPRNMAVVNFAGALPLVQFVWKKLLEQDSGTLAVVSSTTGQKARVDEAVYAGTKHAQVGFARSLGLEAERLETNARVALFMPGGMRTPFWDTQRPDEYDTFNDPKKVATGMINSVTKQDTVFEEVTVGRGEMV